MAISACFSISLAFSRLSPKIVIPILEVETHSWPSVNFGSQPVSIFEREGDGLQPVHVASTITSPLSVAFSEDHLYILGTTTIESHAIYGHEVSNSADGVATLLKADG